MSDQLIQYIVNAVIGGLLAWYVQWRTHKSDKLTITKADASDKLTIEKATEVKKEVTEVKEEVAIVKVQTDGMKDELVKVTGLYSEAVGKALGRAEQKSETDAGMISGGAVPLKVEVVNEPLHVVTPVVPDTPVKVQVVNEPLKVVPTKKTGGGEVK